MTDPRQLVDEFALRFEAGEEPDPSEWLSRVDGEQRQELEGLIDRYLMTAPRRAWDPVAYESSAAKGAVDRVYESLGGVSGNWPELLPRLRNAARVKRSDLVRRLAEALNPGAGEPQIDKVGSYYHQMEHGLLPAEGVSGRVIEALAGIVGASADLIRQAGAGAQPAGGQASPAFARVTLEDRYSAPSGAGVESLDIVDADMSAAGELAGLDEIDRLFTGG